MTVPVTESLLQRYAGEPSYERGAAYFVHGRVADLWVNAGEVAARVEGSGGAVYGVQLWRAEGRLQWRCDCPVGQRGELCKHAVAVGLAALAEEPPAEGGGGSVRAYLESLDHADLVDLLLEQAGRDEALATRLEGAAMANGEGETDPDHLRRFVEEALDPGEFVGWGEVGAFLEEAESVLPLLDRVTDRDPGLAVNLAERALRAGMSALDSVDDSTGQMGEFLSEVGNRFEGAIRAAEWRGADVAETLFPLLRDQPFDILEVAPFLDLLGDAGLDRLWQRAKEEHKGAGSGAYEDPAIERRALREIQVAAAYARGDVDGVVAALSGSPQALDAHMRIARVLEGAGRLAEAIAWAEADQRGWPNPRLVEWLAAAYGRTGRWQEALDLTWWQFTQRPDSASYETLRTTAQAAGDTEEWRERAVAWVGERTGREWSAQRKGSLQVAIFLQEGMPQRALAAFRELGADNERQGALAKALEAEDPGTAGDLLAGLVEGIIDRRNNRAYDEAVALLRRIADLWARADRNQQTASLVADIRERHRRKRNLMARLDAAFEASR